MTKRAKTNPNCRRHHAAGHTEMPLVDLADPRTAASFGITAAEMGIDLSLDEEEGGDYPYIPRNHDSIALGALVRDRITHFTGTAYSRTHQLVGPVMYGVLPVHADDTESIAMLTYVPWSRLEVLEGPGALANLPGATAENC